MLKTITNEDYFIDLTFFLIGSSSWAQRKAQNLTLLVTIDGQILEDVIDGQFVIKDKDGKPVQKMPFLAWVGRLEMNSEDYNKFLKVPKEDSLYVHFENNDFKLDTNYVYEGKIPLGLINDRYLILNIYNKKNKDSQQKYVFPDHMDYVFQVVAPGYYTKLKFIEKPR